MLGTKEAHVFGNHTCAALGERDFMVVMEVLLRAADYTPAAISFPNLEFHMSRNKTCVRKFDYTAKGFAFYRSE